MGIRSTAMPEGGRILRLPASGCPIDFLMEEHFRQREFCAALESLADDPSRGASAAPALLSHQRDWLPLHVQDEELALFPLLMVRARPEDALEPLIARLRREHAASGERGLALCRILKRLAQGRGLSPADAEVMRRHAADVRRHLIVENAIVLPMARARLTSADKVRLLRRLRNHRDRLAATPANGARS